MCSHLSKFYSQLDKQRQTRADQQLRPYPFSAQSALGLPRHHEKTIRVAPDLPHSVAHGRNTHVGRHELIQYAAVVRHLGQVLASLIRQRLPAERQVQPLEHSYKDWRTSKISEAWCCKVSLTATSSQKAPLAQGSFSQSGLSSFWVKGQPRLGLSAPVAVALEGRTSGRCEASGVSALANRASTGYSV